jgi:hypothetical protein
VHNHSRTLPYRFILMNVQISDTWGFFLFSHLLLKNDSRLWRQVIQFGMKICLLKYNKYLAKYFLMF